MSWFGPGNLTTWMRSGFSALSRYGSVIRGAASVTSASQRFQTKAKYSLWKTSSSEPWKPTIPDVLSYYGCDSAEAECVAMPLLILNMARRGSGPRSRRNTDLETSGGGRRQTGTNDTAGR